MVSPFGICLSCFLSPCSGFPGPWASCHTRENVKGVFTKGKRNGGRKHKRKRQEASEADGLRQRQGSEAETESGIWRQRPTFGGAPEIKCFQCPCAQEPLQISAQKVKKNESVIRTAI